MGVRQQRCGWWDTHTLVPDRDLITLLRPSLSWLRRHLQDDLIYGDDRRTG
jgi:hypothetical protein